MSIIGQCTTFIFVSAKACTKFIAMSLFFLRPARGCGAGSVGQTFFRWGALVRAEKTLSSSQGFLFICLSKKKKRRRNTDLCSRMNPFTLFFQRKPFVYLAKHLRAAMIRVPSTRRQNPERIVFHCGQSDPPLFRSSLSRTGGCVLQRGVTATN